MTGVRISVIVMTYKKFDNLHKNISSILKQTFENYEVIVSDDGSPNLDTQYVYSLFPKDDKKEHFRLLTRQHNVGTVRNYNEAITYAKGDIIVPLSQDDVFYNEETLKAIDESFDNNTNVCLGLRKVLGKETLLPNYKQQSIIQEGDTKKLWFRNACKNMFYGASLYWRKSFLIQLGLFDESYLLLEDYPFVMKCIEKGETIKILSQPTILWDNKGVSGTQRETGLLREDIIRFDKILYDKSSTLLKSRTCRNYLYHQIYWSCGSAIKKYRYLIVDCIIAISKIAAILSKQDVIDCRFEILWYLERRASNNRSD